MLCARDVARPPRPAGLPGKHCNHDRVSIACDVAPTRLGRVDARGRARVRLVRRDDFAGGCAGRVSLRSGGKARSARFDFGRVPPSDGGPRTRVVRLKAPRAAAGPATVRTRVYQAYGHAQRFALR